MWQQITGSVLLVLCGIGIGIDIAWIIEKHREKKLLDDVRFEIYRADDDEAAEELFNRLKEGLDSEEEERDRDSV